MADPNETYVGDDGVTYYVNSAWDRPGTWQNAAKEGRLASHAYGKAKGLLNDPEMPWNAQSGLLAFLDTASMPAKAVASGLLALPDRMNSVTQSAQSGDYYPALEDAMSVAFSGLPIGTAAAPSGVAGMMAGKLPKAAKAAEAALPMDEASRMARADDMRISPKKLYHGTDADIAKIDPTKFDKRGLYGPGFYMTDSPSVAGGTEFQYGYAGRTTGSNVIPVMARTETPLYIDKLGGNLSSEITKSIADELKNSGIDHKWVSSAYDMPGEEIYRKIESQFNGDREAVNSLLRRSGIDSIIHKGGNIVGRDMGYSPHMVTISLDPTAIRSRFAAFDPAKRDSADLLASVGGPGGLLGLAAANRDEEKRK